MADINVNGLWYLINKTERTAKVTFPSDKHEKYEGNIVIPNSIQYNDVEYEVTSIGEYAFQNCQNLHTIIVSNSITKIEWHAFEGCLKLSAIRLSDQITSIDRSVFAHCVSLTKIQIPASVIFLGEDIFQDCVSLQTIIVEEGNIKFDSRRDCNAIIETDTNTLIIGCKSSKIPEGIEIIKHHAFFGCIGLTNIVIPASVLKIQRDVFINCSHLESIIVEQGNLTYDSRGNSNAIIDTYSGELVGGCKNTSIPQGVTSIGECAFWGCSYLTNIKIPEGVTAIEGYAFHGCSNLESITMPKGLERIERGAFRDCKSLLSAHIPHSVYHVGDYTFEGCEQLKSVVISKNLTSIRECSFRGCKNLTTIDLPESIVQIERSAFEDCTSLMQVKIANQVERVGYYVFKNCKSLESIIIPENVKAIGGGTFWGCEKLSNVYNCSECPPEQPKFLIDGEIIPIFEHRQLETVYLHVPIHLVECYKNSYPWSCFKNITHFIAKVDKITLSAAKVLLLKESVFSMHHTVYPNYATNKKLIWSSSNEEVAVVNSKGRVVALSRGSAIITSTANDGSGVCASCEVMVKQFVQEIRFNKASVKLTEGTSLVLDVTVMPDDADDVSFIWHTTNDDVAMIVGDGRIIAVSPGTAVISATSNDGNGASAMCEVIVTERKR